MKMEDVTKILLDGQKQQTEMLQKVSSEVAQLSNEVVRLSAKIEERGRIDEEHERQRKSDNEDFHNEITDVKKQTDENTKTINQIKGGLLVVGKIVAIASIAATLVSCVIPYITGK